MIDPQDFRTARQSVLFRNVADDVSRSLISECHSVQVARGKALFRQGDKADAMFVVLRGWIKLARVTPAGDEVILSVYSKGESFAEAIALQGEFYPVTAEAVSDCRVLVIRASVILGSLASRPELAVQMLSCAYKHLHELVMQIEGMKALSGAQRLAAFLIALAPVEEGSCTFSLPYDKALIAGRLGMKPESLSRAFGRLRQAGVVVSRNHIAIADIRRLHDFVEEDKASGWQQIGS